MNLVIGSTSQLAHYFPEDYVRMSSRETDWGYLRENNWESVYITFAEQRIYDRDVDYITPNYLMTMSAINAALESANKIVCYTSCELWNDLSGHISADIKPKFYPLDNEYTISKLLLWNKVVEKRKFNSLYNKVIFVHPFYFNSVYRNKYFLFGKIFDSIIKKQRIDVGSLDFYRDMVHASFVVKKSIEATSDCMIGSGKLFHARTFIKDLYQLNNMDFDEYVKENVSVLPTGKEKLIMAKVPWEYAYEDLLSDTQTELEQFMTMEKQWI